MSFSMSSLSLVLPARLGARRAPRAAPAKPAPLLSSFEGGLRRCAGLGESTGAPSPPPRRTSGCLPLLP